jgi:hypothetical protein
LAYQLSEPILSNWRPQGRRALFAPKGTGSHFVNDHYIVKGDHCMPMRSSKPIEHRQAGPGCANHEVASDCSLVVEEDDQGAPFDSMQRFAFAYVPVRWAERVTAKSNQHFLHSFIFRVMEVEPRPPQRLGARHVLHALDPALVNDDDIITMSEYGSHQAAARLAANSITASATRSS